MTPVASYVSENAAARGRLAAIVSRLTDEDLAKPVGDDWTVSSALVHLAFWDWCRLALLQRWELLGVGDMPYNSDIINSCVALAVSIPPRAAAEMAVKAAQALDQEIEKLPAELATAIMDSGNNRVLERHLHRNLHLDDIGKGLANR